MSFTLLAVLFSILTLNSQEVALKAENDSLWQRIIFLEEQLASTADGPKLSYEQLNNIVSEAVQRAVQAERVSQAAAATEAVAKARDAEASRFTYFSTTIFCAPAGTRCANCSSTTLTSNGARIPPTPLGRYIDTADSTQYTEEGSYQNKPVWCLDMPMAEITPRGGKWLHAAEQWTIGGPGLPRPVREYSLRGKSESFETRKTIGQEYMRLDCSASKFRALYPGADKRSMKDLCKSIDWEASQRYHQEQEEKRRTAAASKAAGTTARPVSMTM